MTQPYVHCPFCIEEFDLVCDTSIELFGNMDMTAIHCKKHGDIIIITENIYRKASGGSFIADCPNCDRTIHLSEMKNLRGNG